MNSAKPITNKNERYAAAMAALYRIARHKCEYPDDFCDGYFDLQHIARNTLKSFGKTKNFGGR